MTAIYETLLQRGFVQDETPAVRARLTDRPITAYIGFDPTADSLHVGSLVPAMALAWLQRLGGTPVILVGGGTGMVGDPSGKRNERPMLDVAQIDANARAIESQLRRFVSFEGAAAARMVDNAAWLRDLHLMEFLRDVGKHFTVNYMLQKDSVKSRMETGISFTEFTYMLVQAYDFWHLFQTYGCELQMGGSDQWGNITAGIELIARREQKQAHGLVFPLLATSSGSKFGKTEAGNVWLDPTRTSPYQFFQFWLNVEDADVERYLGLFTFLPMEEIALLMAAQRENSAGRPAQRKLAEEITAIVHGADEAVRAVAASAVMFGGEIAEGATLDYDALASTMPTFEMPRAKYADGPAIVDVLVETGLAKSKGEAKRGIEGRGFTVNDETVVDANRRLGEGDLRDGRFVVLRKGKKNYAMLKIG